MTTNKQNKDRWHIIVEECNTKMVSQFRQFIQLAVAGVTDATGLLVVILECTIKTQALIKAVIKFYIIKFRIILKITQF